MKRTKSALLVAIILSLLASCGETQSPSEAQTTVPAATTVPEDTKFAPDSLPDDLDLGGDTVNIMLGDYNNAMLEDMYAEEETGNRLSDAVYNMITGVEDRLNCDLVYNVEAYVSAERAAFQQKICTSILAGDDTMDVLFDLNNYATQMHEGEYFVNLADTKYIDLAKPWYNQTVLENIYGDYIHFVSGDFSLANVKNSFAVYVNQDLYTALGKTEDLYSLVDDGKWTLDAMKGLLTDTYADLNGDTAADAGDRYGLTFGDFNKYLGFLPAFNGSIFKKSGEGYEFVYGSERVQDIVQAMCSLVHENENVLPADPSSTGIDDFRLPSGGGNYMSKPFLEGRSMMSCSLVADASMIIPEIDFSYSLLPYPKWDEAQENYITFLQRSCYALIPVTCTDTDAASAVLEALSSASHRTIIPEYCEVSLKVRYSQDDDVARMFDLIRQSIRYEAGDIYLVTSASLTGYLRNQIKANNTDWASFIESNKGSWIEGMRKIAPVS